MFKASPRFAECCCVRHRHKAVPVLRDHLYSYDLSGPNRELRKRERVSFVRHIDSEKLKGHYMIDFVTYNGLGNFVSSEVASFCAPVKALVEENPGALSNVSPNARS